MLARANQGTGWGQEVTAKAPPVVTGQTAAEGALPEGPDGGRTLPEAVVVDDAVEPTVDADRLSRDGDVVTLDGNVVVHYADYTVEADHVEFDTGTKDLKATGHLHAMGGRNHEEIRASRGEVNLGTRTGRFYDVTGSVGVKSSAGKRMVYLNDSPFLFSGREVVKTGPESYEVIDGTVTSCQMPHPDWVLSSSRFMVDDDKARAKGSVFKLLNIPLLYLPYVTHPTAEDSRQSGLLIPVIGQSSTKGLVLGEQVYFALNRSNDLTVGAEYFSMRGWLDQVTFRNRGVGDNFVLSHYSQLFDRGYTPAGGAYVNQGGEDFTISARHDFGVRTRTVADIEYLSSYVYREAFTENFNQAVSTDIVSTAYGVHAWNGYTAAVEADRYQGEKRVPVAATATTPAIGDQQIRIFHVPALDFTAGEHPLGRSGFVWGVDAQATGLKRVQPNFVTSGVAERLDVRPSLAYGVGVTDGWRLRGEAAVRETVYSRSRVVPSGTGPGGVTRESTDPLNRADFEGTVEVRAPVAEREFEAPWLEKLARGPVRHTIEPYATYRYVTGVSNFQNVLRFDDRDVVSNTNEIEYGVTQRVYARSAARNGRCGTGATDLDAPDLDTVDGDGGAAVNGTALAGVSGGVVMRDGTVVQPRCTAREWISWRVAQKGFFNPTFGGAVVTGRRNIFSSTLDFAGVAFVTEPREISPLISRLRVRSTDTLDVEWDLDVDTGAKRVLANNVLLDLHRGNTFGGLSYARLNAPGRSYVEGINQLTADFDQMRLLLGYGKPTKAGLSLAGNVGLDLNRTQVQYGAVETSYNWNCCGLSVEYRKYELGSVRNENAYRFNFTLANIGTAGNLRRAERLF